MKNNKGLRLVNQYTYIDILNAYLDCRKHKRTKKSAIAYELAFEYNLMFLLDKINSGEYEVGPSHVFAIDKPKPREIWAAEFQDRIVHHLIYNDIGPFFEKRFVEDSFSCIKGRGTLAASKRVEKFARKATENWSKSAWVLQIDIANYFVSISKDILWSIIEKTIGNHNTLTEKLLKQIVFNDVISNYIINSTRYFDEIPKHKTLFKVKSNYGLPVGNLTSQLFANIYLDGLDKYIKHELKIKYYARYVDDAVLISRNRDELVNSIDKINQWLQDNRELHLQPNKIRIALITDGINFVGRIIKPFYTTTRPMIVDNAKRSFKNLRNDPLNAHYFTSANSYLGIFKHSNTYNLRKRLYNIIGLPTIIGTDANYSKIFYIY